MIHREYIEWFAYHRHEELKDLIVNSSTLHGEVDNLLRSDHALMLQKLDRIGDVLVGLLGQLHEFKGIAMAVAPKLGLSEQALSILRQFVNSGADRLFYENFGGENFVLNFGGDDHVEITDIRFLDDDIKALLELGLIYHEEGMIYRIKRNAVRLIEAIGTKRAEDV